MLNHLGLYVWHIQQCIEVMQTNTKQYKTIYTSETMLNKTLQINRKSIIFYNRKVGLLSHLGLYACHIQHRNVLQPVYYKQRLFCYLLLFLF